MTDNIRVALRVRPLAPQEALDQGPQKFIDFGKDGKSILFLEKSSYRQFSFDFVGDEHTTQEAIFTQIGLPISNNCLTGYNGTIFAYGQTGSGKTHTIIGPPTSRSLSDHSAGVLPRCIHYIFSSILSESTRNPHIHYLVKCSFLEIYNETIQDLLKSTAKNLHIREDIKKGTYVEDLTQETVVTYEETLEYLEVGLKSRHCGSTFMNKESSRSHSVFTLNIESKEQRGEITTYKSSFFHLIDLAGSERQKLTGTNGERLREASLINKSLSTLGDVINALVENSEGKRKYVRYRDSKLTFLLKDSIGGNSKTCIIANISPCNKSYGETLSTLRFAERAKKVKNKAVINEDNLGVIMELKAEILKLQQKLEGKLGLQVNEKEFRELEELLALNIDIRLNTESTLQGLLSTKECQINGLNDVLKKFETKIVNDSFRIKSRANQVNVLKKNEPVYESVLVQELEKEIELLTNEYNNHPMALKYFYENDLLRDEIKNLECEIKEAPSSLGRRLKNSQEFTEKLCEHLKVSSAEKAKLEQLGLENNHKINDLTVKLKDSQDFIDDLSADLYLCKQKLSILEEESSFRKINCMLIDEENFSNQCKKEAMRKLDVNIPHTPKVSLNSFGGSLICSECITKNETIRNLEQTLQNFGQQNDELRYYEEESYRLHEENKKWRMEVDDKDLIIQQLILENNCLCDENNYLTTELQSGNQEFVENLLEGSTGECSNLRQDLIQSMKSREQMIKELKKTQKKEGELIKEIEELRQKLKDSKAEALWFKAKKEDIEKENVKLVGHTNPNQKIQHLSMIKKEYNQQKEVIAKQREEIQLKTGKIEELQRKYENLVKAKGISDIIAEDENERQRVKDIEQQLSEISEDIQKTMDFVTELPYYKHVEGQSIENCIKGLVEFLTVELESKQQDLLINNGELERKENALMLVNNELLLYKQRLRMHENN